MFCSANSFNQPLNKWNVSNVSGMESMFMGARSFNQPLNDWNVSKVTSIIYMFMYARSFNQPLDNWNVSNVEYMVGMFAFANSFNQPLDKWNVSKVKNMNYMFAEAGRAPRRHPGRQLPLNERPLPRVMTTPLYTLPRSFHSSIIKPTSSYRAQSTRRALALRALPRSFQSSITKSARGAWPTARTRGALALRAEEFLQRK